ncbi:hypothetical protein CFK38_05325 [Brachybacterium vulturis]|uniref:Uncharacterized protein n=1 Tax=Brachybacterium vulturis TaxID=2017484 RepID=A0A291GLC7_9MICO|nr:hypothetical protein [Brachybacterium vulturis]ATG51015.1 hypothetical protein CFK38_05325 [Brachybacterium vulturis]
MTPPAPSSPPLRRAAVAVAALAALSVLVSVVIMVVAALPRSEVAGAVLQVSYLAAGVLSVLLSAAVVLLVQHASGSADAVRRSALLVLGLLAVTLLVDPVQSVVMNVLVLGDVLPSGPDAATAVVTLTVRGPASLVLLVMGLLALLIAARAAREPRTLRIPGTPTVLAVVLAVLALSALASVAASWLVSGMRPGGGGVAVLLTSAPSLIGGLSHALLVPAGALVIARTAGASRRLAWFALGAEWLSVVAVTLLYRMLILQLSLTGTASFVLWNGLAAGAQVLAMGTVLVLALVVAVLVRGSGSRPSPAPATP